MTTTGAGHDGRTSADLLVDVAVRAPIGAALMLADRGCAEVGRLRASVEQQLTLARVVGQLTVVMGRSRLRARLADLRGDAPAPARTASPVVRPLRLVPDAPPGPEGPAPVGDPPVTEVAPPVDAAALFDDTGLAGEEAVTDHEEPLDRPLPRVDELPPAHEVPPVDDLAIPGYDDLSASQVVQHLDGLDPGELAAIAAYEAAGRGRRTILHRIHQLAG